MNQLQDLQQQTQRQRQPVIVSIHAALQRLHKFRREIDSSAAESRLAECARQLRAANASDQEKLDAVLAWSEEGLLEHTNAFQQLTLELIDRQNQVTLRCTL
jgi:hypothetical protein